jgi:hypothetical protein
MPSGATTNLITDTSRFQLYHAAGAIFYARSREAGRVFMASGSRATSADAAWLFERYGASVIAETEGEGYEHIVSEFNGALVLLEIGDGFVSWTVASEKAEQARSVARDIARILPPPTRAAGAIRVAFWSYNPTFGAQVRYRQIDAPTFSDIATNYPEVTRASLAALEKASPERLLLFLGPPGTGKTYAIRALLRAWAERGIEAHYIVDPDTFFGDADYMLSVLLGDDAPRVLVLEDADDIATGKIGGASRSRVLNALEGFIGQGLRLAMLITATTEEALDDSLTRQGRCMGRVEFGRFSGTEAEAWLRERGAAQGPSDSNCTLAELFAMAAGATP